MWIESASDIYIVLFGKLSFLPIFHYFHYYFFSFQGRILLFFIWIFNPGGLFKKGRKFIATFRLFSMKETVLSLVISSSTRNLQSVMSVDIHGPAELLIVKECQKN